MSPADARIIPERASRILDALPDMVFVLDDVGRIVEANERCRSLLGWTNDDLGRHALEFVHPDDVDVVATSMISIEGKAVGTPIELRVGDSDGAWRWIELIGADMRATDGGHGVVCVGRDITQRRMWEVAGGDLARFQQVVQHAASITMLLDGAGTIMSVNNAFTRLLGHDQSVVVGQPLVSFAVPASAGTLGAALDRCIAASDGQSVEVTMRTADGAAEGRPLQLEIRNLSADPVLDGLIVTGHDVSDLRVARHKLEYLAGHDALTGLANRSLLLTRMTAMVTAGEPLAILFIDLDHFKPINDVLGHEAGDELLQCVSRRLELSTRPGDIVARVGGDEFVVIAPGIVSQDVADKLVQRLEDAISEPFELRSGPARVGASAGIVLSDASSTVEGLLSGADMAMYDAKAARRGGSVRSALPGSSPELRRRLLHDLAVGIGRGEVVAFVQPIVHLETGRVTAVEALARWQHPRLGLLLPGSFIGLAEDADLDVGLGERVLESACETVRAACVVMPGLNLCINLSAGQLAEPGLGASVLSHLAEAGLTPDRLIVEITERVTLTRRRTRGGPTPESALHDLRRLGIKLSLDDFGTGHSSLTHLRRYPLASIKIDRHFVAGMVDHPEDLAVVAAVIGLGTALGLWVVAEAVETDAQLQMLREMGCSHAQGNIISPALPPAAFIDWLTRRLRDHR
ncbi:MAG: EAL domain-containing protein [Ilumatobacteraceae bacterium]